MTTPPLRTFGLFAGIGGLELGLSMGGPFTSVGFCEQNLYARAVLSKNWPGVPHYDDVRTLTGHALAADGIGRIDVLTAGFPCQPHSLAGKRAASEDDRDLWGEVARIAAETRPRWLVAENVPGLLSSADPLHGRGAGGFFGRVLRDLARLGFDAEWHSLSAAAVGAAHLRNRVFIVAHAHHPERWEESEGRHEPNGHDAGRAQTAGGLAARCADDVDDAQRIGRQSGWDDHGKHDRNKSGPTSEDAAALADANGARSGELLGGYEAEQPCPIYSGQHTSPLAHASSTGRRQQHAPAEPGSAGHVAGGRDAVQHSASEGSPDWAGGTVGQPSPLTEFERPGGREVECDFRGVAHGVSARVQRLERLGNAVVPQCAAVLGRAITEAEAYCARYGVMPEQIVQPRHLRGPV